MKETTSAGGVIIKEKNGKLSVLLLGTNEGKYFLPKGHVEGTETLEEAAYREVAEEAGINQVKILRHLGCCKRIVEEHREDKTIHYFLMIPTILDELHQETEDNRGLTFEWHPIDKLPEFYLDEQERIITDNIELITQEHHKARGK